MASSIKTPSKTAPTTAKKSTSKAPAKKAPTKPKTNSTAGLNSIASQIEAAASGKGGATGSGKASDYYSTYVAAARSLNVITRYANGKPVNASGAALLDRFLTRDDAQARELQMLLYKNGFYGSTSLKNIRLGDAKDPNTLEAFAQAIVAIGQIQDSGISTGLYDLLREGSKYATPESGGGQGPAPFSFTPTDDSTIRKYVTDVVPNVIGRGLSEAEQQQLVNQFQAMQTDVARQAYNANTAGGVTEGAPDLEQFLTDESKKLRPEDAKAYGELKRADSLGALFGLQT